MNFRQRYSSALTDPVTLAAIALLLVNDHLFKLLWPGHVITGKLSDLAWMVFAPPFLAFLFSFVTGGRASAERNAFWAAYVGLPLLYVAFNSVPALHDLIIGVFLPLTGSFSGSPLDPSDSLVVPLAVAIALWIRRNALVSAPAYRTRLCVLAAVVASFATVATSVAAPSETEWHVGILDDGAVIMEGPSYDHYVSLNGGLTWEPTEVEDYDDVAWGASDVETTRGVYELREHDVVLFEGSSNGQVVYSSQFLLKGANRWAQNYGTQRLRSEISQLYDDPEQLIGQIPFNILYHESSGQVVVGMGLEGVVVGMPDGSWRRVGVDKFVPTDVSLGGKARLLFSANYWLVLLSMALSVLSVVVLSLELTYSLRGGLSRKTQPAASSALSLRVRRFTFLLLLVSIFTPFLYVIGFVWGPDISFLLPYSLRGFVIGGCVLLTPVLLFVIGRSLFRQGLLRMAIGIFFALLGIAFSGVAFPAFAVGTGSLFLPDVGLLFAAVGLIFAALAVVTYPPTLKDVPAWAVALLAMVLLPGLPFLLWLSGGLVLPLAITSSLAMLAVLAWLLRFYLVRRRTVEESPSYDIAET